MEAVVQDFPNYKQELQKLHFQMQKQDGRFRRIEEHLPCILPQTELPGSNVKDLARVESASVDGAK